MGTSIQLKMMSKVFIILHLVLFFVQFGNGNVIDYLNEDEQEKEKPCENFDERYKDKFLEELCRGNEDRFECQALKCKIRFPTSLLTNNLKQNEKRLRCIERVCSSYESELICQKIEKCAAEKKGPLGKTLYKVCIVKVLL